MKTIWIINEYAGSPYHGMEFRHYYLARQFIKRGYKVYIISASFSHLFTQKPEVKNDFKLESIDGIKYLWVKVPKYSDSFDKKRILKWLIFTYKTFSRLPVNHLERPDIIIVSPMAPFSIISGYKWAKKYNAKLIYEVKDIWPLTLIEIGGYSTYHPFIKLLEFFEKFAYKKAHKVVSVLPLAFKHMIKQGMPKEKFEYIPNGICFQDLKNVEPLPVNILEKIPLNSFTVAYIGTFGKTNALEYLVKAANILRGNKDVHFLLVGSGMEIDFLKNLSKKLNLKNVTFLPAVKRSQVPKILENVDIAYIGWRRNKIYDYGISANKIFDYMMAGKPILHSFSGKGDLIAMANAGITVEAENPEAIVEGILRLYKMSPTERKRLGENGRKYVLENHTYDKLAQKYMELF